MSRPAGVPRRRAEQVRAGAAFFAARDMRTGHYSAMWHSFSVGQLLANDLNRISRAHGISIADFHLLGVLMIDAPTPQTASRLALTLNVSNAVLSGRIARLAERGMIARGAVAHDRRAVPLAITPAGVACVEAVGHALEREARFVRQFARLSAEDQAALGRIMGELHEALDRDFVPVARADV